MHPAHGALEIRTDKSGINLGLTNSSGTSRRDPLPLHRQQKMDLGHLEKSTRSLTGMGFKKKIKLLLKEMLKVKLVWLCDLS